MTECSWEEILGFRNSYELGDFTKWLNDQIEKKTAEEISEQKSSLMDDFKQRWFIHKNSGTKWRLILPDGPSFTWSFRSFKSNDKCPWNEITGSGKSDEGICGFKDYNDFEYFASWLENQVKLGRAREVVEDPISHIEKQAIGKKYYMHNKSGTLWRLLWPDGPRRPYFERIKNTQK